MKSFVLIFALFLMNALADSSDRSQECFVGKSEFAQIYAKIRGRETQLMAIQAASEEFNDYKNQATSLPVKIYNAVLMPFAHFIIGHGIGAFANLNNSELKVRYKSKLEKIKQLPDPFERIQLVYDLTRKTQGRYDQEFVGILTLMRGFVFNWGNPENILGAVENTGTAGVCRDFSALLNWSLLQVARYSKSTSHALAPTDFSSEVATSPDHAWVRVHIPKYENNRLKGFIDFDLDTTIYSEGYVPLYPRHQGLTTGEMYEIGHELYSIGQCLEKLN